MSASPSGSWWSRLVHRLHSTPEPTPPEPSLNELATAGESPLTTPGTDPRRAEIRFPNSRCPRNQTPRRPDVQSSDLEAEVAARIDALVDAGAVDEGGIQTLEGYLAPVLAQQTARLGAQFAHVLECHLHMQAQLVRDITEVTARVQRLRREITDLDISYSHARNTLLGVPSTVGWAAASELRDSDLGDRFIPRTSPTSPDPTTALAEPR